MSAEFFTPSWVETRDRVRLVVARHGEYVPYVPGQPYPRVGSRGDAPLSDAGHRQAALLAARLVALGADALYATPLVRTQQTAAPFAELADLQTKVLEEFAEVSLGDLEGPGFRALSESGDPLIAELYASQDWGLLPSGETTQEFRSRIESGLELIRELHMGQTVVLVTHGGVVAMLCHLATGCGPIELFPTEYTAISEFSIQRSRLVLRTYNDFGHLSCPLSEASFDGGELNRPRVH